MSHPNQTTLSWLVKYIQETLKCNYIDAFDIAWAIDKWFKHLTTGVSSH